MNKNITSFHKNFLIVLILTFTSSTYSLVQLSSDVLDKIRSEYGQLAYIRVLDWSQLVENLLSDKVDSQLYEINNFFNKVPYYTDQEHWSKPDYWATPIEMLGTNGADCEDYVIAKYFSLIELGIPDSKLRMMFVTALEQNQAHMVLAYYPEPNAIPLILDNINPRILPANKRRDLRPVYSFNGEGLYKAKAQGRGTKLGNSRHKMWDDLTRRIERDF